MGVITRMKRWLGPDQSSRPSPPPSRVPRPAEPSRPARVPPPVAIDLHTPNDLDAELEGFDPSPPESPVEGRPRRPARSRQELITELQRNYQEVLGIVRKVDGHLDAQTQRSVRLAEVAERLPGAADDLAALRAGHEHTNSALASLTESIREADARQSRGQEAQLERLDELRGLLAESSEAERELIGSLIDFRDVMTSVHAATGELTRAVVRMEEREQARGAEFLEAMESTRAWLTTLAVIGGVCALVAVTLGIVAVG